MPVGPVRSVGRTSVVTRRAELHEMITEVQTQGLHAGAIVREIETQITGINDIVRRRRKNHVAQLVLLALTTAQGAAAIKMHFSAPLPGERGRSVLQAPNTQSRAACAVFQEDGNFVVYDSSDNPLWAAGTYHKATYLSIQNDGNVVAYNGARQPVWATNTGD